jgi:hypothetical protein
LDYVKQFK